MYPSPLRTIGSRDTVQRLLTAYHAIEGCLDRGDLPLDPAQISSTVLVSFVNSLPEESTDCREDCDQSKTHIRFYPKVTEDIDGKREYRVDTCCKPSLTDPRHATSSGFIPDLLHYRREIDERLLNRFAFSNAPGQNTAKLSMEEDKAGLAWLMECIIVEHTSDRSQKPKVVECVGYESEKQLTDATIQAWYPTIPGVSLEPVPRPGETWASWCKRAVSFGLLGIKSAQQECDVNSMV